MNRTILSLTLLTAILAIMAARGVTLPLWMAFCGAVTLAIVFTLFSLGEWMERNSGGIE